MASNDKQKLIDDIFVETISVPRHDQQAFLLGRCKGLEAGIREEVVKLLRADEAAAKANFSHPELNVAEFMDAKPVAQSGKDEGSTIGNYRLLQKLGEGGMGVVFMADQLQPVRRRVALKLLKPGMDSQQIIARFEAERQAIAMMDHPNIAKMLDVGTSETGHPYFVMELVKGVPITRYCDENHLPVRKRLNLFVAVCNAVQHAHQKGIIHRDLKPTNILVAEYDNSLVPKVIDFGVAKAVEQPLTDKTLFTKFGQVVGTYEYMSPEQAKLNQLDIDTRTDIYSLGVLLYELLTGCTPFDSSTLRSAAFDEMLKMIRETEPPRPSKKLTGIADSSMVAASRQTEPTKLSRLLRRDLDAIVMKALDKERGRRYETSAAFADDVQRYVNDEPVTASPPSSVYYLSRFVRRNRTAVTTAGLFIFTLMAATALITFAWRSSDRLADANLVLADDNASQAMTLSEQLRTATLTRMATESRAVRTESPIRSLLLAAEAVEISQRDTGGVLPIAHEALLNATSALPGIPLGVGTQPVASSPDGRWLVTVTKTPGLSLWDFDSQDPIDSRTDFPTMMCATVTSDSRWLYTSDSNGMISVTDLKNTPTHSSTVVDTKSSMSSVAVDPKQRWLATACRDGVVRVFDLRAEHPSATCYNLDHFYGAETHYEVQFSNDGRWICGRIAGSQVAQTGRKVQLWRVTDNEIAEAPLNLNAHNRRISAMQLTIDGAWLFTGSRDKTVCQWDLSSDDPSRQPFWVIDKDIQHGVDALRVSTGGRWLAIAADTLQIWDLAAENTDESFRQLRGHGGYVLSLAFSSDGRSLVSGSVDSSVRLWDLAHDGPTGDCLVLRGHEAPVSGVWISRNNRWLVSSTTKGSRLWDLSSLDPASPNQVLQAASDTGGMSADLPHRRIRDVATTRDGHALVTSSLDGTLRLWSLAHPNPASTRQDLEGHKGHVRSLALSSGGQRLISVGQEARLWDLASKGGGFSSVVLPGHRGRIRRAAMSPNDRWASTADDAGNIRLWDFSSHDPTPQDLRGHLGGIGVTEFSPDSRYLATASDRDTDSRILLWNLESTDVGDKPITLLGHRQQAGIYSVAFADNSPLLATSGNDGKVLLWDLSTQTPTRLREIDVQDAIWRIALSTNGRWLAVGRFGKESLLLFDLTSDPLVSHELPSHAAVQCVTISSDNRWLAIGTARDQAFLWDLGARGIQSSRRVLRGNRGGVRTVEFSSDNRWLITGDDDGRVILWDLDLDELLKRARQAAGRELSNEEQQEFNLNREWQRQPQTLSQDESTSS